MKVVALISGGKDSCYAMQLAQQAGHELVALANLLPPPESPDDLHSYMYQTVSARIGLLCWALRLSHLVCASKRLLPWLTQVGHQLVEAYAACTGLPLFRKHIRGASKRQARCSVLPAKSLHTLCVSLPIAPHMLWRCGPEGSCTWRSLVFVHTRMMCRST
jgi:diphthamide synthase (EF-2-diphthine--ammonia ligase)